jgi:hypothetical protein
LLLQLSHTNAIFFPQELAGVSEAEMEYAQSLYQEDYENGQLTNTSLVNNAIAAGLANLTYEELLFAEAAVDVCGDLEDLENVTEIMKPPEKMEDENNQIVASLSLGQPVNAFFCDASSNQVPDPVLSQGDTIRVCVRLSQTSLYFHLEDIYMMAFTQPTTGVNTYYAVYDGDASAVATKNCELGLCNILSQVPSRFFDQDSGPVRIVGVALLNFGPQDRRVLAPFDFSGRRQLQNGDAPRSVFELEAGIIGSLEQQGWAPTNNSYETSGIGNAGILLLATTVTVFAVIVFLVFWWRRKQEASNKPFELIMFAAGCGLGFCFCTRRSRKEEKEEVAKRHCSAATVGTYPSQGSVYSSSSGQYINYRARDLQID